MAPSTTEIDSPKVAYYEGWFRHAKKAVGPLRTDEAQRLDSTGEPYAVVIGDQDQPECFIEVSRGTYGVSFLDPLKREHLMYTFEDAGDGRVFLKEAVYREFDGESDTVAKATIYRFSRDGHVQVEKGEKPFRKAAVSDGAADVSRNWEPKPVFGEYRQIIRRER
jgi:hypothetical protein